MEDSLSEVEVGGEKGCEDKDEGVDATEEEVSVAVDSIEGGGNEDVDDIAVTCYIDIRRPLLSPK